MRRLSLEMLLERLMHYGTLACSLVIAAGILLEAVSNSPFDLVTVGIIGFIALPVLRQVVMLLRYASTKDMPMVRVVPLGIALVFAGMILGIIWK